MKKTFQLGLLFLGALALSLTLATAEGKCSGDKSAGTTQEAKCDSGKDTKCNGDTKEKKCNGADADAKKETESKPAPAKGKCGQGKCG